MCCCCRCSSHLPSPLPPPFHSVRLVLEGVRQENIAVEVGGWAGGGDVCVCVCVCVRVCVWCLSYWWGRLQISAATSAVITDRCALYACASRVPSLLHNISSAAEKLRPQPSKPKLDEGIEGQEACVGVLLGGTWSQWGKAGEERRFSSSGFSPP